MKRILTLSVRSRAPVNFMLAAFKHSSSDRLSTAMVCKNMTVSRRNTNYEGTFRDFEIKLQVSPRDQIDVFHIKYSGKVQCL